MVISSSEAIQAPLASQLPLRSPLRSSSLRMLWLLGNRVTEYGVGDGDALIAVVTPSVCVCALPGLLVGSDLCS